MKHSLFTVAVLFASASALADVSTVINEACKKSVVKKLTGASGSCRVIAAPKEASKEICQGSWGSMNCSVSYDPAMTDSEMVLTCYSQSGDSQVIPMKASGATFSIATIIKKSDGKDIVSLDPVEYSLFSNDMVDMSVTVDQGKKTGSINLMPEPGYVISLSDVECK